MKKRLEAIKSILLKEQKIYVDTLSTRLFVSKVTIRKDLSHLEKAGFLFRRYGGAILAENSQEVISHLQKRTINYDAKEQIAECAIRHIKDSSNIFLDAGSTPLLLARKLSGYEDLLVVTNSLPIANILTSQEGVAVELTGGSLRKTSGALIGPATNKMLNERIRVDKVFLGFSGFDIYRGFSSENAIEAETKHAALACSREVILLGDHTKFKRPAFANFASFEDIDRLITDRKPEKEIQIKLEEFAIMINC
ncbi:MAG: DeoR/GlpR family DNA-binding transcription regulator [Verrucomicrobiota bacterium]|nr:DeoR/GlpR family DNA-binding transcription regulator [Verrucomicrobiota bacterium]